MRDEKVDLPIVKAAFAKVVTFFSFMPHSVMMLTCLTAVRADKLI